MDKYKPITDICRHKAIFFDDNGVFVGKKRLDYSKSTFIFNNRGYNFLPDQCSFFKLVSLFSTTKYYIYNINNPMPLIINKKVDPVVNSEAYGVFLRTDILKKLNDLSKPNWLKALLTPRNLIIFFILLVVIWFFASGGDLKELTSSIQNLGSTGGQNG